MILSYTWWLRRYLVGYLLGSNFDDGLVQDSLGWIVKVYDERDSCTLFWWDVLHITQVMDMILWNNITFSHLGSFADSDCPTKTNRFGIYPCIFPHVACPLCCLVPVQWNLLSQVITKILQQAWPETNPSRQLLVLRHLTSQGWYVTDRTSHIIIPALTLK